MPEILERGLREMLAEKPGEFQDENAIIELLAGQPTPEQVLAIRPSPEFQARVSELLGRNKEGVLSRQEDTELERYLTLEHLVRLAKAHAHKQLVVQLSAYEHNGGLSISGLTVRRSYHREINGQILAEHVSGES